MQVVGVPWLWALLYALVALSAPAGIAKQLGSARFRARKRSRLR